MTEFIPWPKTARWNRDITITEKLDGTNACVQIHAVNADDKPMESSRVVKAGEFYYNLIAQSRKRIITPSDDNAGFAAWVWANAESLVDDLGAGVHYGEWWGQGIQSKYGMNRKVFSLFNTGKWEDADFITDGLDVVPVLYEGPMDAYEIDQALDMVDEYSVAAANYGIYNATAEGICIFHSASRTVYKITLLNDEKPKSQP